MVTRLSSSKDLFRKSKNMAKNYFELCDYDRKIYGSHADLKKLSDRELEQHFISFGIAEGREYCHIKNRKDFVHMIDEYGKMLEIGPLDNPQLNYQSPFYYSLDVFNKEQLIKNYINHSNVNKEKIIEPSYVITNNDYSVIKEKFDCVFSSHSIEHMPCIVTFLNNLEGLLTDKGGIYLIIPDKRYCFDHFKRETDIYDVLQAFYEKNSRPRFSDVLKMVSQVTHNNAIDHWSNHHGNINIQSDLTSNYHDFLGRYNSGVYIDAHVSFFTPHSFLEIIDLLNRLKLINLKVNKIYHTLKNNLEFYAILRKDIQLFLK
jgi:hypothetical protein